MSHVSPLTEQSYVWQYLSCPRAHSNQKRWDVNESRPSHFFLFERWVTSLCKKKWYHIPLKNVWYEWVTPLHSPNSCMWQYLSSLRARIPTKKSEIWMSHVPLIFFFEWGGTSLLENMWYEWVATLSTHRVVILGKICPVHVRIPIKQWDMNESRLSHFWRYGWVTPLSTHRVVIRGNICLVHVRIPINVSPIHFPLVVGRFSNQSVTQICIHFQFFACKSVSYVFREPTNRAGWLWLVGSFETQVAFAEYCLFYRAPLQKRPMFVGSLLIVATQYCRREVLQSRRAYLK